MGKVIHYSVDIETLSTSSRAVVLSFGIIRLTPLDTNLPSDLYGCISINEQTKMGREISSETLDWWMDQPSEIWRQARSSPMHPQQAVQIITDFLTGDLAPDDSYTLWTKGPAFDGAILTDLCMQFHPLGDKAIDFRAHRDVRTLEAIVGMKVPPFDGAHNALTDAYHQGRFVTSALDILSRGLDGNSIPATSQA